MFKLLKQKKQNKYYQPKIGCLSKCLSKMKVKYALKIFFNLFSKALLFFFIKKFFNVYFWKSEKETEHKQG